MLENLTKLQKTLLIYRNMRGSRIEKRTLLSKSEAMFGYEHPSLYKRSSELLKLGYVKKKIEIIGDLNLGGDIALSFYTVTKSGLYCDLYKVSMSKNYKPYKHQSRLQKIIKSFTSLFTKTNE